MSNQDSALIFIDDHHCSSFICVFRLCSFVKIYH